MYSNENMCNVELNNIYLYIYNDEVTRHLKFCCISIFYKSSTMTPKV